ncbi:MAG TPA: hypothetical protein VMU68_01230 [Acidimicrobiales bacterium]|nr:hypothetical protein [Acidimicrobiales bacterium]
MVDVDSRYMAARRVLLDALIALSPHGNAVIVVGAQAIYLRTGDADLAIAPYTTDGDLAINPSLLGDDPLLSRAMLDANFTLLRGPQGHEEPGIWVEPADVDGEMELIEVDLIVPHAVTPPGGRRGARLGTHGNSTARSAVGLEAALIDHSSMVINALDPGDARSIRVEVAGASALLVAKAHKIHDRVTSRREDRVDDKDAFDVVRIMQTTDPDEIGGVLSDLIVDPMAGDATRTATEYLQQLFGRRGQFGIQMAARATRLVMDYDTVEVICTTYIGALTRRISPL